MTRRRPKGLDLPVIARPGVQQEAVPGPIPRPPRHLGPAGRRAWRAVMAHAPLLAPGLDVLSVRRLAELVDERETLADEVRTRGVLLDEAVVDPKGGVAAYRVVPNPALAALRAADRALDALSASLAITPKARADLGLVLTQAERSALELREVLAGIAQRRAP